MPGGTYEGRFRAAGALAVVVELGLQKRLTDENNAALLTGCVPFPAVLNSALTQCHVGGKTYLVAWTKSDIPSFAVGREGDKGVLCLKI